jgi:hypothetical protein
VLKWDAPKQDKGKHGKFEALWIGPFNISEVFSNNTYKLHNLEDSEVFGGPVNGGFLKKIFGLSHDFLSIHFKYHFLFYLCLNK